MGCKCNGRLGNSGDPSCPKLMDIAGKFIFTPRFNSTGGENSIDLTDTIDSAYITARLNDLDATMRWYPSPGELKNVSDTRGDSKYQTFDDDTKYFLRQGARSVNAISPGLDTRTFKQFEEYKCVEIGVYIVDLQGNLIGSRRDGDSSNTLYPIMISRGSFDPRYLKKTGDAAPGIQWMFDYSMVERDGDLYMINSDEIGSNLLTIKGLYDVIGTVASITTTGFTLTLETIFGVPVTGLVVGDFYDEAGGTASKIYNVTDSSAVAITSVTETADGVYAFVFGAQTSADVLRVTPVKTKFDFSTVPDVVITVP